jgi:thiol-disulfide isomerase/thioredoxin
MASLLRCCGVCCLLGLLVLGVDAAAVTLVAANFSTVVTGNQPVLVEFWSPDCGACTSFLPDFRIVENALSGSSIAIARVNAQLDSALFQSFHLSQVPSLVMFPIGWDQSKGPTVYQQAYGMRADPIVQFALDYAALPTPTSTPDANGRMRDHIRTNLQRIFDYLPAMAADAKAAAVDFTSYLSVRDFVYGVVDGKLRNDPVALGAWFGRSDNTSVGNTKVLSNGQTLQYGIWKGVVNAWGLYYDEAALPWAPTTTEPFPTSPAPFSSNSWAAAVKDLPIGSVAFLPLAVWPSFLERGVAVTAVIVLDNKLGTISVFGIDLSLECIALFAKVLKAETQQELLVVDPTFAIVAAGLMELTRPTYYNVSAPALFPNGILPFTPFGRSAFASATYGPVAEVIQARYPQFGNQSETLHSAELFFTLRGTPQTAAITILVVGNLRFAIVAYMDSLKSAASRSAVEGTTIALAVVGAGLGVALLFLIVAFTLYLVNRARQREKLERGEEMKEAPNFNA